MGPKFGHGMRSFAHRRQNQSAERHRSFTADDRGVTETGIPVGCLANAGAQEAAVIFYPYLAAG
jgi:hypothetical protein